jgi:predicted nuclease of predicted toxin-antitoxin system
VAHWLRHRGHTVTCLRDVLPVSAPDSELLAWASAHEAILVSCSRNDFLALGSEGVHPGIIVLIRRRTRQAEIAAMQQLLTRAGEQGLASNINFA